MADRRSKASKAEKLAELKRAREGGGRNWKVRRVKRDFREDFTDAIFFSKKKTMICMMK